MSDWKQSSVRQLNDRNRVCRYCKTSSGQKKMNDTITRVRQRLQDVWSGRKKSS